MKMPRLSSISNFMVTSRCSGRCTTCNIWKTTPAPDPPIEKIKEFFEENYEILRNLEFIQLTGGEPFLLDDLHEIAETVHGVAPRCMMWLPTNGLLLDKIEDTTQRILAIIDEPRVGVTVSLDGEGVMHDIQLGLDGSYKKAIETLNRLSKLKPLGLSVSTGFTLTSDNYKHAPIIQKIAYQHGVDFSLRPINISEHYYQNMDKKGDFPHEEITESLDTVGYTVNEEKGTLGCPTNLAYIQGAKEFISNKRTMPCSASSESVFIDALGDVYPCIVMNHRLGNIYQTNLSDILSSPSSWEARDKIKKIQCPTCWLECEAFRDKKKDWGRLLKALIWGVKLSA